MSNPKKKPEQPSHTAISETFLTKDKWPVKVEIFWGQRLDRQQQLEGAKDGATLRVKPEFISDKFFGHLLNSVSDVFPQRNPIIKKDYWQHHLDYFDIGLGRLEEDDASSLVKRVGEFVTAMQKEPGHFLSDEVTTKMAPVLESVLRDYGSSLNKALAQDTVIEHPERLKEGILTGKAVSLSEGIIFGYRIIQYGASKREISFIAEPYEKDTQFGLSVSVRVEGGVPFLRQVPYDQLSGVPTVIEEAIRILIEQSREAAWETHEK